MKLPLADTATTSPWSAPQSCLGGGPFFCAGASGISYIEEVGDVTDELRDEYDFTAAGPNPYSKRLKKQVTIRLDVDTIEYFKALAGRTGVPYQSLINLYLADCAAEKRELALTWT